jgi:hypothetical protein
VVQGCSREFRRRFTSAAVTTTSAVLARLRRTNFGSATITLWASAVVIALAVSAVLAPASTVLMLRTRAGLALSLATPTVFLLASAAVATRRALTLCCAVYRVDECG